MILANLSFDNTHLGLNEELGMGGEDVHMPTLFIRIPAWSDVLNYHYNRCNIQTKNNVHLIFIKHKSRSK
jgi:hypothetical protein